MTDQNQNEQTELLQTIQKCVSKGYCDASIFINNNERWYRADYIKQMWVYFIGNSPVFLERLPLGWTSSRPKQSNISVKEHLTIDVNKEPHKKRYVEYWEPLFEHFIKLIDPNKKQTKILLCNTNSIRYSNFAIIYWKGKLTVIQLTNTHMNVELMNNMLIKDGHIGQFCQVIVTHLNE